MSPASSQLPQYLVARFDENNKLGIARAFKWTGPSWPNILVGKAGGGSAGTGAILPETFTGSNSTMRIKWIRVFKPAGQEGSTR